MWDLPGPGIEPMSPALAGWFLTTAPPGKSLKLLSPRNCHSSDITPLWYELFEYLLKRDSFLLLTWFGSQLGKALELNIEALEKKALYPVMMIIFDITFQNRSSAVDPEPQVKLEDILPLAFTRLCEPKEASYSLIRKYVSQYYPKLRVDIRYEPEAWTLNTDVCVTSLSPFSWERRKIKYSVRITFRWARNKTFFCGFYFLSHYIFLFISPYVVSFWNSNRMLTFTGLW